MNRIVLDRDRPSAAWVGGKFARQAEMAAAGIAVPRFFCLTRACFDEVVAPFRDEVRARLEAVDFADRASIARAAEAIRALFAAARVPPGLEEEVLERFDALMAGGALVSVRSSTVGRRPEESEDSDRNPFAGISDSFLYVPRGELLEKVRLCWASGFNEEGILYRRAQGIDLFPHDVAAVPAARTFPRHRGKVGFGVAVGVQRMVMGERSFVLFTCDPKTSARDTVIVAGHGIGEGVVQEKVAVDHFFVNGLTGEMRREVAEKPEMLAFDGARGSGIARRPVPEALRRAPALSDEEIRALVILGRRIEGIFRSPQDIEGTIEAGGAVSILQARPVAIDWRRQRVFTNANVTESFPGVTTALTYSFARFFYRVIFHDCYRRLGIPADDLHREHEALDRMVAFLGGRVYYCLTSFYHLHSQSPLFPLFRAHWEKMMGFATSFHTEPEGLAARLWDATRRTARLGAATGTLLYRYATHEREIRSFHEWWEALISPLRGRTFEDEDPLTLCGEFHRVWREVGDRWGVTLMNDTYLPLAYGLAGSLVKRWGLDRDASLIADLLCGDERLLSVEIVLSAVRLSEEVHRDPGLSRAFAEEDAAELWRRIEAGALPPPFCEAVKRHLHRYGDRGLEELKMEQPNLRHTPARFVEMVKGYARAGLTAEGFLAKERAVRAAGEARLAALLDGRPLERAALRRLLASLRRLIGNRENSRYCRSELFGFSKNVFRALGAALVRDGVLREREDVFHLAMDEVLGFFDGTGVTEDLQALADLRRAEMERNRTRELMTQVTTLGPVRRNTLERPEERGPGAAGEDGILRGLGSSAGKVRGRARVVLDPNAPLGSSDDRILVARETDPGWLFLMLASKGIVVERGSMLSHTAITGRKFGIPTVVAVPEATRRIPDGALVEVDGAAGVVTILDNRASLGKSVDG